MIGKFVICQHNAQSGSAIGGTGLLEARVLPKVSWLQRESVWARANARHSGCQPAAALGMGCATIIALSVAISDGGCRGDVCNNGRPRSRVKLATGQAGLQ